MYSMYNCFQRLPVGLVPDAEPLESGACERLHRGIKNLSDKNRIMFQITFLINNNDINNLNISSEKFINDAELDDDFKDLILKNRSECIK